MAKIPQQYTQAQMALRKLCDGFNANESKVCRLHFPPKTHEIVEIRRRVFRGRNLGVQDPLESSGFSPAETGGSCGTVGRQGPNLGTQLP